MAISKIGGSTSDNWELISSVTPTAASAAVNFTALSLYKKLAVRFSGIVLGTAGAVDIRLNNDSGVKYDSGYFDDVSGSGLSYKTDTDSSQFRLGTSNTQWSGYLEFVNCDTTGLKQISNGWAYSRTATDNRRNFTGGVYRASAVITQFNFICTTTFTAVGSVDLYGVK